MIVHLPVPPRWVRDAAAAWPVASQRRARRNALVAATALARDRVERREVEDYLASRPGPVAGPVGGPWRSSA